MARKHKREKSPAFQWYPKDALTDSKLKHMGLTAEGMYRRLLDNAWIENGLPDDLDEIYTLSNCATRAKFDALWKTVSIKFPVAADGRRRNPRQERTRKEQRKNSKKKKLAARARWDKEQISTDARASNADASASPVHCSSASTAFALSKELQVDQIHRRPKRGGLSVEERDVKRLAMMATADLLQPLAIAGIRLPDVDVLAESIQQQVKNRKYDMPCRPETARLAAEKALKHWRRSA